MEKKITKADVKQVDIQKLIDTLYQNAVKELELNEDERNLLEEKLITTEGYRLPVYLNIARSNPNVRMEKIKGLEDKKIIKRYFVDGKPCIEIIHDKYAAAAKRERDFKILINQKKLRLLKEQEELKLKISEEERKVAQERAIYEERKRYDNELMSKEKELLIAKEHQFLQSTKISRLKKLSIAGLIVFLMILVIIIFYYNKIRNDELYDYANNNIQLNIDSTSAYSDTLSGKTGSFSTPSYSDTLSSYRGNEVLDSLDNTYKTKKVLYIKDIEQLQNELNQSQDAHSKLKLLLDKNSITIKQLQSENENYKKQIGILRPKSRKSDY